MPVSAGVLRRLTDAVRDRDEPFIAGKSSIHVGRGRPAVRLALSDGTVTDAGRKYLELVQARGNPLAFPPVEGTPKAIADLGDWNYLIGFGLLLVGLMVSAHPSTPLGRGRAELAGQSRAGRPPRLEALLARGPATRPRP